MTEIQEYVKQHYAELPKSSFDDQECVIVHEVRNEDYGFGHHSYEGIGIRQDGSTVWAYSSGCSCEGWTTLVEHSDRKSVKFLSADFDVDDIDPKSVDFNSLRVSMSSY